MILRIVIKLYNHKHNLVPEYSHPCKSNSIFISNHSLLPLPSPSKSLNPQQPLIYILSLWACLFWIFYVNGLIQYIALSVFFKLVCFFKVHPCYIIYRYFFLFYGWIAYHCVNMPLFVYPSINWWDIWDVYNFWLL